MILLQLVGLHIKVIYPRLVELVLLVIFLCTHLVVFGVTLVGMVGLMVLVGTDNA